MSEAHKIIKFIDTDFNLLFTVQDGGNVLVTLGSGQTVPMVCRYVDETHVEINNQRFDMRDLAQIMDSNGNIYSPEVPPDLPEMCYSTHHESGKLIRIERGKSGYSTLSFSSPYPEHNKKIAAFYNSRLHVTPQQEAAMYAGSMSEWDVRASNPANYDVGGNRIPSIFDSLEMRKPDDAFDNAIKKGLKNPECYMYMYSKDGRDYFKHEDTRNYIDFKFEKPKVKREASSPTTANTKKPVREDLDR